MSDDARMRALDAVAEAVETWVDTPLGEGNSLNDYMAVKAALREWQRLRNAHPAPRATAETVRVAMWQATDGLIWWCIPHSRWDEDEGGRDAIRLGTTTLRLDTEAEG